MSHPRSTRSVTDLIRPARPTDLAAMARIHVTSGVPGLLTDLGDRFLRTVYYKRLLAHPLGHALVVEVGSAVVGFVTWSPRSTELFGAIFRGAAPRVLLTVLTRAARRPRVLVDVAQTILAVRAPVEADEPAAEIVSLEVERAYQGLGLGFFLLEASVSALEKSGAAPIKARILADHPAVERLYLRLGFVERKRFQLHGRPWKLMTK